MRKRPPDTQTFLLQTSLLDRFNASLCTAVTGQNNSQAILQELDRANLFLFPLDDNRQWYRYHHLFADLLRQRLRLRHPESIIDLYQRASQWYAERGDVEKAIHYALEDEDVFKAAHQSGKVTAVIGRSADMYCAGALNSSFNSTFGQRHFYPLLEGKMVDILGDIDQPHTYAFVDDVAHGLIRLAEHDDALGQIWHIPAAPTLSQRALMTLAFEEAGLPPKIRGSKISGYFLRAIGLFQKDVAEVSEMLYQFEKPLLVSHQKFERAYGATPTPHREALRQTLEWYRLNPLAN